VTTFTSEAIEPAVVERVEYAWIESLAAYHIEWQRAMTTAFAFLARAKIRRERDLLMLTAEQLYGIFVESERHASHLRLLERRSGDVRQHCRDAGRYG
jgi:hypothetical protein